MAMLNNQMEYPFRDDLYLKKMVIFHSYYVGLVEGKMLPVERPLGFHIVSDFLFGWLVWCYN